jgi:hypothetical protein
MNKSELIKALRARQGSRSMTEFANAELKTSAAYLSMLYSGAKEPGPAVLDYLGLEREVVVIYKPKQPKRRWR